MKLAEVFAQVNAQEDKEMGYVFDAPVHYIVLNRKDNTWTQSTITKYLAILDQIEASTGPGVMVTIGTGARHFSSGFSLPHWVKDKKNMFESIQMFQDLLARVMTFPMPTFCVMNGNAIAGGYILSLAHDWRMMNGK